MYFFIFQPDHTLKLCLKFNRSQPIYARVANTAGKTGKTGKIAFFEIRLENLEKDIFLLLQGWKNWKNIFRNF